MVSAETPDPAEPPAPGTSPLDSGLQRVAEAMRPEEGGDT